MTDGDSNAADETAGQTTVLKLGGSVITQKDARETIDDDALNRAVAAVADASRDRRRGGTHDRLVIVHGGGSFGHPNAVDHGVSRTAGTADAAATMAIHGAMTTLAYAVVERLQNAGVPALPVHPLSVGARDGTGGLSLPTNVVETMLGEGFVPILHGDVIAHVGAGTTIVSGDELVVELAVGLDADRVGLCSTVPGVLDAEDEVIDRIDDYDAVEAVLGGSDATDVTGGMAAKVRTLLDLDAPASIFGPAELSGFLSGESVGTVIDG